MACFPDVNVWVALALAGHTHQTAAARWLTETAVDVIVFNRVTQHGFLRLLTNPRITGKNVLSYAQAWATYDIFYQDPRVEFRNEPDGLEEVWREESRRQNRRGPNFWTDAYLSAFARAAGLTIVTFDRAFHHHRGLKVEVLS